ncbi:1,3-beta-glucan synthase component FKS1 [Cryptococcus deuterogattii 99/473]|uniref:1,3-beta-glucan synthase n=1 Tax=Cryptococcus deuterogattii Ram5 TaxID=1296110 RepID=A0A0D0UW69_9TREE|nr:1,3-beta-glucan synthase component FKS1 [Cryptococcus deuterogattii LA55]KIR38384.1 1,3-beta-glucan synthase component FKS1 [Cryptococcus deuterogattii Ram5]KIR69664.1 1,3-beta-glucan synthase component FKS1 [Cryptococcus deuterogattii CA1014]KIR89611.1 1,3-beta-glucan synthase component FKS1 [Cryptococcus deuterogattii CBS 10090]KIY54393.1 1,3-beta-glucan synthase component FKS1 [Cryptococcus deuterogattii 99/473]
MSYPNPPPAPKGSASFSSASSDPFNQTNQLPYDSNAQYAPQQAFAHPNAPNPGAGGAGVAPPGQGGQYAPYYDNEPEMGGRWEGGGMGRETWAKPNYPSSDYHGGPGYLPSRASTPTFEGSNAGHRPREPYPAWTVDSNIPLSKEEIEDVLIDLANKFGFQKDSSRNVYDFLMIQLDSRASRMSPNQALLTLHADYIGGEHANYRKWYFAAQLDLDDAIGAVQNPGLNRVRSVARRGGKSKNPLATAQEKSLESATSRWRTAMNNMSQYDRLRQVALYLLCWGEAAQVRFMPECLCFIFKCADDYYRSPECQNRQEAVPEGLYMRAVIKPLYKFLRDQGYEVVDGKFLRRERDHDKIIGYDDTRLVDIPPAQRFMKFDRIDWNKVFFKTYLEKRSFFHLLVNFNRIWVLHISVFWFFTAYNAPSIYAPSGSTTATTPMAWSMTGLGGFVATLIMIAATLAEFSYIPTTWNNTSHLTRRLIFLLIILAITGGPSIYIAFFNQTGRVALILGIVQFFCSVVATIAFATLPSGRMFGDRVAGKSRKYLANQTFTASYPSLGFYPRVASFLLWFLIFGCKFTESYFFLTLSFRDPMKVMNGMKVQNCRDKYLGSGLCMNQPAFALAVMFVMDLTLFFLDTFLWYVIWNTVFSIARSFAIGMSIWTPWKDIFARLPKRIYAKILATDDMEVKYKPKVLVSQVWNAVIISMYREHLLSIEHVQKLLYHQIQSDQPGKRTLRAPAFFISQNEKGSKAEFFPKGSEAERRICFFAQSLTTSIPAPISVEAMPTFTVLVPHYSEKILLSLREIIREEDQNTRVTLLEYLKQLHPVEWDNFVRDTKILAEESDAFNGGNPFASDEKEEVKKADDIPFYTIGFKSAAPEYTLRTRIWASLRAQTLYRTVSGFMNYSKAIKLLYRVENPEVVQLFGGNTDQLERELERMARRKFKFVVSMQRYSKFNKEEHENAEFLLRAYPDLQIAYLDEEPPRKDGGESRIFSALIDGHSEIMPNGRRRPKFRIELPGNPILGDGKSDNQNHAIIFYRGEYLQLIDANQDNYLEECLKIRNVLGEFEEFKVSTQSPYAAQGHADFAKFPVAILGAREYIFSENIGILGDIAAGKEQTFGTLAARSLSYIGGKLHYGHPDFLNAIYMNTRGGVSKAQKGLHLNEDIFAGMLAFGRGGRIKHSEYYQCGKGRDLGFGTILNFQTKIGTGMGEQMLSREYYYLGTQLPIDRFLTFYYGHPGFHINNILVMMSVQVFMLALVFLGTLNKQLTVCRYSSSGDILPGQSGCYNLVPVFKWIKRCIISIFIVFWIAFVPLFVQDISLLVVVLLPLESLSAFFIWVPHLIYFWITVVGLCVAPFLFNPHQFAIADFVIDYREFIRWMSRGNSRTHANSWVGYCRLSRTRVTGFKRKRLGLPSEKLSSDVPRAPWKAILVGEIIGPICLAILFVICYLFVKSFAVDGQVQPGLVRIAVIALGPIIWNMALLITLFLISVFLGPCFGATMAALAHFGAVAGMLVFFELLWFLELWNTSHAVLGIIAVISVQRCIFKFLIAVFLSREFKHDETNRAWWTGVWFNRGLGSHALSQPAREFVVKTIEMGLYSADFIACHLLLALLTIPMFIPYFDRVHATMLFWLAPNQQIRPPIYSFRQRNQRRKIVFKCIFIALIVVPIIFKDVAGLTPKSVPFNGVI